MEYHSNKSLTKKAQSLRKNMTKEERHLWYDYLKKLPVNIYRQRVFDHYILDFYCANTKTAIELDGSQHYDAERKEKDKKRDAYLKEKGITVLRYSNYDVNYRFGAVCRDIEGHIMGGGPHPSAALPPSPEGKAPHPAPSESPSPEGKAPHPAPSEPPSPKGKADERYSCGKSCLIESIYQFLDSSVDCITTDQVIIAERVQNILDNRSDRMILEDRLNDFWQQFM